MVHRGGGSNRKDLASSCTAVYENKPGILIYLWLYPVPRSNLGQKLLRECVQGKKKPEERERACVLAGNKVAKLHGCGVFVYLGKDGLPLFVLHLFTYVKMCYIWVK